MIKIISIILVLFVSGITANVFFHHYKIDNADCLYIKSNLNVPESERYGEWFYQFSPHLEQEFEERCQEDSNERI